MTHHHCRAGLGALVALALAAAGTAVPAGAQEDAAGSDPVQFHINNITDFHGHIEFDEKNQEPGAERLKCAVDAEAGELPSDFVASGDLVGGSPFVSSMTQDEPTIEVLNQMGLKYSAVGNHEFDKGWEDLRDRIVPAADWQYLGANAEGTDLAPYAVSDLGGVKVAYVGSVTATMPTLVSPAGIEGLSFPDPVAATNKVADELTASGEADVVVALFHEGVQDPSVFSENVDVVFAGHTHQEVPPDRQQGAPLVMQAGSYSKNLNSVDFSYDPTTDELTVDDAEMLGFDEIAACDSPYPEIAATVSAAKEVADVEGAKTVAEVDAPLLRGTNAGADSGSNRGVESTANNALAEAARWAVTDKTDQTADIGVMNAGGVRADLPAGPVTYAQAYAVQPFGNSITWTRLRGADFKDALEQQWQKGDDRPVLSLGVSDNVSYVYDVNAPAGERIRHVTVDGEPLDPEREYVVAGSTFLLGGGDSFEALTRGTETHDIGKMDIDAFIGYLRNHGDAGPRAGQSGVSVTLPETVAPGEDVDVELASLIYSADDPARTVTVRLGEAEATADIDPDLGEPGHGEAGTATVTLPLPADATAETPLTVTTDAGTEISAPLGALTDTDPSEPAEAGSSDGGRAATVIGAAVSSVVAVLALLAGLGNPAIREQVDQLFRQFLGPLR